MSTSESSDNVQRSCCIHMESCKINLHENVKPFTQKNLDKCKLILKVRTKLNLRYTSFRLPNVCDDNRFGYHTECYRSFTAVKKAQIELANTLPYSCKTQGQGDLIPRTSSVPASSEDAHLCPIQLTRTTSSKILKDSRRGVLRNICIFCGKLFLYVNRKKIPLSSCLTKNFEQNVKHFAHYLNDKELIRKIADIDFVAKEVKYHRICRVKYEKDYNNAKKIKENIERPQSKIFQEAYTHAFDLLCRYIQENVIDQPSALYVSRILEMYNHYYAAKLQECIENVQEEVYKTGHTNSSMKLKLKEHFQNSLKFNMHGKIMILYNANMSFSDALCYISTENNTNNFLEIQNIAFKLREEILRMKKNQLPEQLELHNIFHGECDIPEILSTFISCLLSGPYSRRMKNLERVKINSFCHDLIYCITNGRIKPSKQLELGMVIKSLTNSRKIIDILNKFGHCASYNVLEEIETELTYTAMETSSLLPSTLTKTPDLSTGLAFDNFDRFVETLSGKDTLHDTVGIIYQFDTPAAIESSSKLTLPSTSGISTSRKRRRAFHIDDPEIEPYYKKPKLTDFLAIPIDQEQIFPSKYQNLDELWIFSLSLLNQEMPMWIGWNHQRNQDTYCKQKIWYLPPINESPTSYSVVLHTLKMAKQIAAKCQQKYICVTYDLAIAKMALQLQNTESPTYDNVFILLGSFHIQMSFFKAVGKYIEESGGPYILTETNILAPGSLKGFLTGTHFNRCKRIHEIFAAAVESLHIQEFLKTQDAGPLQESISELKALQQMETDDISLSANLQSLLTNYEAYYEATEKGHHGATAQYWINYVNLIKLYNMFSRSIRCNDLNLYLICLLRISSVMFAFNHQNYSRWILRFYANLFHIDETHPGLQETLINGGFSIRRTDKAFSRLPIDLTLEQTINADAANKMTGILSMTNSISARRRWALSHSLRTSILTHLLGELDLCKSEDITDELRPHMIRKNYKSYKDIEEALKRNLNPFDDLSKSENLFNISTGKAVNEEAKMFLLNAISIGEKARNSFITDCNNDSTRFERPIKKVNIKTFASDAKSVVCKSKQIVKEIKFERNLLGRILTLAMNHQIDLESILKFPLTPVPLALSHIDGSINKTAKSIFFNFLEKQGVTNCIPSHIDCTIVDGFYFIHLHAKQLPQTFGKIARFILLKAMNLKGKRIDLVFDQFVSPSIKNIEHQRRGNQEVNFAIVGEEQKAPNDFLKSLRNNRFKVALVEFLIENWNAHEYANIIGNKELYVNCQNVCYKYIAINGLIVKSLEETLYSEHEEADSRIVFHLSQLPEAAKVIIKASDTDILIILLGNIHRLPIDLQIWMECGLVSKNTLRLVDVNQIARYFKENVCKALPAFHAYTGCDYTAAFSRKAKLGPFKLLQKNPSIQAIFGNMGEKEHLSEEDIAGIEKFTCEIYRKPRHNNIDKARYDIFIDHFKPTSRPFEKLKNFEGSNLPPCKDILLQKMKRTNQIAAIWRFAFEHKPKFYDPLNNGWKMDENNNYCIEWFSGPQYPQTIEDILVSENVESDDEDVDCPLSSEDEEAD